MIKNKLIVTILLSNLVGLCSSDLLCAFPYHPTIPLTIQTEGYFTDTKAPTIKQLIIHTRFIANHQETVFSASTNLESAPPISIIKFSDTIPVEIQKNPTSPYQTLTETLYFATGYPIPLDILPVSQATETKEYYSTRSVGGRTFKQKIVITVSPLTVNEATNNGWLQLHPPLDPQMQLRLFTATTTNKLLSRQLWPENGDWWLYEETPFRRSWRIK